MRTTVTFTANSGSPTNVTIPQGITAFSAILGLASGSGRIPGGLFVVTDNNFVSPPDAFQVPQDRTYTFRGSLSGTIGTVQLCAAGDGWSSQQPQAFANFQLLIDF
jgi:hypothetical protein